jgi:histidinol-phosphate aminotransferase
LVAGLPAATPFVGPETLERRLGRRLEVRLGANESNFGPSESVLAAIRQAADEIQYYGDPEGFVLRSAIGSRLGLGPEHVVLGSGVDELLGVLVRAYMAPGETVVMGHGAYPTFTYQVVGHGGRIVNRPYRGFRNDPEALVEAARDEGAKLLYLSNPDNPTGSHLSAESQIALIERLPPGCLLVLDEAYAEFAPPGSLPELGADDPRVIRLRTFSKAHGLAGMRVGYAFGAPDLIRPFDRIRNQFGVGRLAQAAALAALEDEAHVRAVVAAVERGRAEYAVLANDTGVVGLPSSTNFVAFDLGGAERTKAVLSALLESEGVFVRSPGVTPLDRLLRVTVGRPEDRDAFAAAFRRVLARL